MSGGKKIINKKHVTVRKTVIVQNKTETERNETNCVVDTFRNNKGQLCLKIYPKTGSWASPYFGIDELFALYYNYNEATNLTAPLDFFTKNIFINNKPYLNLHVIVAHGGCSKFNPLIIKLKNIVHTVYIGDYTSLDKGYSYNFGTIKWFPIQNFERVEN